MLAVGRVILSYLALPFACLWVWQQQRRILRGGRALDERETRDARRAGVSHPERIRVCVVDEVPPSLSRPLRGLLLRLGMMVESAGMCLGYGIYLHSDYAHNRRVLVHELAHAAQYERLGGIRRFLRRYLRECAQAGYTGSELEAQAQRTTDDVCR